MVEITKYAVDIKDLTDNARIQDNYDVTGNGWLDNIVEVVNTNIKAQYEAGRINGTDYATVYLGALQAALGESVKIVLQKDIIALQAAGEEAKLGLIDEQILSERAKRGLLIAQMENEKKKLELMEQEIELAKLKVDLTKEQIELTKAQLEIEKAKLPLTEAQTELVLAQVESEKLKLLQISAQTDLIKAQLATENRKPDQVVAQTNLLRNQAATEEKKPLLLDKQIQGESERTKKTIAETSRVKAEEQVAIRQKQGFDDDFRQKLLKQVLDSWSVAFSVAQDENAIPDSIKVNVIDSITKSVTDALNIPIVDDPLNQP
jgi:hypothetical protein